MNLTQDHFALFQQEMRHWVGVFGLQDWRLDFNFQEGEKVGEDGWVTHANVRCKPDNRVCLATLLEVRPDSDNIEEEVRQAARHEAIELLLYEIRYIAECRYCQPEEIDTAIHRIIRRLEAFIDGGAQANTLFISQSYSSDRRNP